MLAHHFSLAEDWAAGAGLPAQGGREGEPGVRAAPGDRPVRRGARGRPAAGRAGAGRDAHGHSSGARRSLLRHRRLRKVAGRSGGARRADPARPGSPRGGRRPGPARQRASVDGGLPGGARAGARGDRDRRGRRGAGAPRRRPLRPRVRARSQRAARCRGGRSRARACNRAGSRRDPTARRWCCICSALGRSWQGEYRASLELASEAVQIAREHRLVVPLHPGSLEPRGGLERDWGTMTRRSRPSSEGLALAEKIGDDAYIPRVPEHARLAPDRLRGLRAGHRAVRALVRGNESLLAGRPRHRRRAARLHPHQRGGRLDGAGRLRERGARRWRRRSTSSSTRRPRAG